jgi:hypothetical protein
MTWRGGLGTNRSGRFQEPSQNIRPLQTFHNQESSQIDTQELMETARTLIAGSASTCWR